MNADDYELLADAIAGEHFAARPAARRQVEQVALAIATALAARNRTFDPVKFMLAACDATAMDQLATPVRRQIVDRFGTSEPRRRASPYYADIPIDPREVQKWTANSRVGYVIPATTQAGNMASGALIDYGGIHTLGELAALTDEEIAAIPRIGPGAMKVIREVLDLWRARQHQGPGPDAASRQENSPQSASQGALSDFPVANPLAGSRRAAAPALTSRQRPTRRRGARSGS